MGILRKCLGMVSGKHLWGAAALGALCFFNGQANADLLMLLEGDKANGPTPTVGLDSGPLGNHMIFEKSGLVAEGKTGGALNFTGENGSYAFLNEASIGTGGLDAVNASQQFTIGFWHAGGETNPKNTSHFWATGVTGTTDRAYQSHATWSNSTIYLDIGGCCGGTQRLQGPLDEEFFKASVGDEWTHLTYTLDGDGNAAIYVNGGDGLGGDQPFLFREGPTDEIPPLQSFTLASQAGAANFWEGRLDDFFIADTALTQAEIAAVVNDGARSFFGVTGEPADYTPQRLVANNEIGVLGVATELTNIVKSDPVVTQGLTQYWYDANLRANPEAFLEAGDEGSDTAPLVAEPFATKDTWWAGSQNPAVISDLTLERYPQVGLAGTRFEGSANSDNYSVRLTGEIFFAENGEYLIRDGIDDFTLVAIDQDGNGELDDVADIINADVGAAGFGDVLVLDDDWANLDGGSQTVDFHGLADIENIAAGGEWRKIEVWMAEGGGGDGGILYIGNLDDPDIFDDTNGDALSQEERDKFVVRGDQLRTTIAVIQSADAAGALEQGIEYVMQVNADGNDKIVIEDPDDVLNSTLDVTNGLVLIQAGEGVSGPVTLFEADTIVGWDSLTINGEGFTKGDPGIIIFGDVSPCDPNSMGDLDGNGKVEFADFLVLAENFGSDATDHTTGDIDCNGKVEFADFLVLAENFGKMTGQASAVPEPSGLALLGIAAMALGLIRKRR